MAHDVDRKPTKSEMRRVEGGVKD